MQRSSVEMLPEEVRKELEQRLIQGAFTGYAALAEWLRSIGYEIGKSSVHRFGKNFEDKIKALKVATDQAKAIAEASEDDAGAMNEALIRLVQTKTFELLIELETSDKNLPKIGQMVAKLARSAVQQKKWSKEHEEQVRKKALEEAADAVEQTARQQGLNEEQARFWREQVLGVRK